MTDPLASGTPLVIAAHGTRDESGVAECRRHRRFPRALTVTRTRQPPSSFR